MGDFLTHRVKRVRVRSVVPQTRYPMGSLFKYDEWGQYYEVCSI
jgi:hypothetical protein